VSETTLIIGTKNYSSWSLRPWILLRHLGIPFREVVLDLDTPRFREEVARVSPTGKVPALIDGATHVWESLAIVEYACEKAGAGWPVDPAARAHARAIASEMHAGFLALRAACPMNARARGRRVAMTPAIAADLARIDAIWTACRKLHAASGPWLFGAYSAADAMYAPVVLRCLTYDLPLSESGRAYMATALADAHLQDWIRAAEADSHVVPADEAGA
jgi:glutathione S-transferase